MSKTWVLMSLGDNAFYSPLPDNDTPGFETIQRDSTYSWVAQGRLSRDPAMQFTGSGEDMIIIEGRLFPHHFGGLSTLEGLRASGRDGKPLPLTRFYAAENEEFSGVPLGNYVIKRVRQSDSLISSVGVPHKVDFTLELSYYGDDLNVGSIGTKLIPNTSEDDFDIIPQEVFPFQELN
jgi:uncharacterized protein